MKQSLMRTAPIFLGLAAIVACGSDSTAPNTALVGAYSASEFRTTGSSGQIDQLQAGSTLNVTLAAGGALSGHLHLAATAANPVFDADMAGTWAQIGNTVRFTQVAVDTFVENIVFNIEPNVNSWDLVGVGDFAGTHINITLSQL